MVVIWRLVLTSTTAGGSSHNTSLLVVRDTLLEEVGLSGQGDGLHEVEGVGGVVVLVITELNKETISDKLNVLSHETCVHSEEVAWKGLSKELLLILDGLDNDILNNLLGWLVSQVLEEQAGKVSVETLVTRDELVGEGESRHETTLLEPEDGGEGTREEDTLNSGEGDEALGECGLLVLDPAESPVCFLLDARDGIDSIEEESALLWVLDVGVDKEGVGLGVNVLHHDLESVEASGLWCLNLVAESLDEVLVDDTIGGGEESQDMRDEESLVVGELVVPIVQILGEIDFLSGPE